MRDRKISILLFVSFLLLLASFLILCTWVYSYFTRDNVAVRPTTVKVLPPRPEVTRDSLLQIYTSSIKSIESQLGTTYTKSDSLESKLNVKLDEYYKLKNELAALLKNPTSNDDFKTARQKISELQKRMEELRSTSSDVEEENARLYKLLAQINKDRKSGAQNVQYVESNPDPAFSKDDAEKDITPFSMSELTLSVTKDEDSDEQDAFSTARKINGTFTLRHSTDLDNAEVMVVVTQPNGHVLQKSAWESGSFQTSDGKKIYSLKLSFTYSKGESKKFAFSIATDKFTRGNYTMQVYNNGVLIGRITKLLS